MAHARSGISRALWSGAEGVPHAAPPWWCAGSACRRSERPAHRRHRQRMGLLAHGAVREGLQTPVWRAAVRDSQAQHRAPLVQRGSCQTKPPNGFRQRCDDEVCIGIRIVRYELPDRFHVFDRLGRPSKLGHPSKRSLTSSWGTVFPSSACLNLRSIFAKKQSFSMASSSVTSSGSSSTAFRMRCLVAGSAIAENAAHSLGKTASTLERISRRR